MKLFPPFNSPIDFESWVILDGLPKNIDDYLWTFLELDKNENIINKRIVVHQTSTPRVMGVIIYIDKDAATVSLMGLRYKLRDFDVSCFKASDLLYVMRQIEEDNQELDTNRTAHIVLLNLTMSDMYEKYIREMLGIRMKSKIESHVLKGKEEVESQQNYFTHTYLLDMFGPVERQQNCRYFYKSCTDAVAALWGLSELHIGCYKFVISSSSPIISAESFEELPFLLTARKVGMVPDKPLEIKSFACCSCSDSALPPPKSSGKSPSGKSSGKSPSGKSSGKSPSGKSSGKSPSGKSSGKSPSSKKSKLCKYCEARNAIRGSCPNSGIECKFDKVGDTVLCLVCGFESPPEARLCSDARDQRGADLDEDLESREITMLLEEASAYYFPFYVHKSNESSKESSSEGTSE